MKQQINILRTTTKFLQADGQKLNVFRNRTLHCISISRRHIRLDVVQYFVPPPLAVHCIEICLCPEVTPGLQGSAALFHVAVGIIAAVS